MLKDIKETTCPDCGNSNIVSESFKSQHCNGHYNEYREFGCGLQLYFSPNFMRTSKDSPCTLNGDFKKKRKARFDAVTRLKNYIDKMKVDNDFRDILKGKFEYVNYDI